MARVYVAEKKII